MKELACLPWKEHVWSFHLLIHASQCKTVSREYSRTARLSHVSFKAGQEKSHEDATNIFNGLVLCVFPIVPRVISTETFAKIMRSIIKEHSIICLTPLLNFSPRSTGSVSGLIQCQVLFTYPSFLPLLELSGSVCRIPRWSPTKAWTRPKTCLASIQNQMFY